MRKIILRDRVIELSKYIVNGLFATAVHYFVLTYSLKVMGIRSAALASVLASVIAITFSYIGNRFFVFRSVSDQVLGQYVKFFWIYCFIASIHGTVLFITTDLLNYDYRIGFFIAVIIQIFLGYVGNKKC